MMRLRNLLILVLIVASVLAVLATFSQFRTLLQTPVAVGSGQVANENVEDGNPPLDIAFASNRDGNWDVYLLQADGELVNLTAASDDDERVYQDYFPSWAADGRQINFISNRASATEMGPAQVMADGTELRGMDIVGAIFSLAREGRFDWDVAWSPDGSQVVWSSIRDLNLELYQAPRADSIDLTAATRLTNGPARDWFASWSPDGTALLFDNDAAGAENILLYRLDEGGSQSLTQTGADAYDQLHGMWSLDGSRIAYISDEGDALLQGNIVVMTLDDAVADITDDDMPAASALDADFVGDPVWSPDGQWMAYVSNESGQWQLYVQPVASDATDADTSSSDTPGRVIRLSQDDGDYLFPVWRP